MKPYELLEKAADHIERVGWCQGTAYGDADKPRKESPCCALGGLGIVEADLETYSEARAILCEYIHLVEGWVPSISMWNDLPGQTVSKVVGGMRGAAESARRLDRTTGAGPSVPSQRTL